MTTNPFEYGGIVGERAFCNRTTELKDLTRAAENGQRLLVYGERRMGKTSLLKRVIENLPTDSFIPVYVDLWPTSNALSFAKAVAKATVASTAGRGERALETARSVVRHLVPTLKLDESGLPVVEFGALTRDEPEPVLEDALDAPARLAAQRGKRVVVIYDEIQRLAEYTDNLSERLVRSRTQSHHDVGYFFAGSRKHLIREMFLDSSRPLYQAAGHYPIGPIATEHWTPFIRERFDRADRRVSESVVAELCSQTEGHPYYTQHLAHALWESTEPGGEADSPLLQSALEVLLRRLSYPFTAMWEGLTTNQRAVLIGLAASQRADSVFSGAFLRSVNLAASSASRAVETLIQNDILDKDENGFLVTDRFFRLWIKKTFTLG